MSWNLLWPVERCVNFNHISLSVKLEICAGSLTDAIAAVVGGADRIELCSALSEGGLTPSAGTICSAVRLPLPVNVLIRPRNGDFIYCESEADLMEMDVRQAIHNGASGIVVGALTPEGHVDQPLCRRLIEAALDENPKADLTFHRAFDVTVSPFDALDTIIDLGFRRVLTSGQASTALKGAPFIAKLKRHAAGRILIMAGAGVSDYNVSDIIRISHADEIHASARSRISSSMVAHHSDASMGAGDATDGSRLATDPDKVKCIKTVIDLMS